MSEEGDRLIIRAMRFSMLGIASIAIIFVIYIVSMMIVAAHDNQRIDALERRIEKLEPEREP